MRHVYMKVDETYGSTCLHSCAYELSSSCTSTNFKSLGK